MNQNKRGKHMRVKRIVVLFLLVMVIATLSSCGKPNGMSDSNYQKCKQLVEVYDAYLDYKIDGLTASEKIEKIAKTIDDDTTVIAMYYAQFWQTAGAMLKLSDDPVWALEERNKIAEGVGLPKR